MKRKKINFKEISSVLSRDEMKKIMAGSSGGCFADGTSCGTNKTCKASGTNCLCGGVNDGNCYKA
ncbi:MAG TPA: hypothetical protein VH396_06415 [Chitinophagaceae bacterium]